MSIIFFISTNLFCLEFKPFYSAVSLEVNMNSYENISFGTSLEAFYSFSKDWKGGVSAEFSSDFFKFNSVEALLHGGYLFPFSFWNNHAKLYAGASAGYEQIWNSEKCTHSFSTGIEGKLFIDFVKTKNLCLNLIPTVRFGYPYLWGTGIALGVLF